MASSSRKASCISTGSTGAVVSFVGNVATACEVAVAGDVVDVGEVDVCGEATGCSDSIGTGSVVAVGSLEALEGSPPVAQAANSRIKQPVAGTSQRNLVQNCI